MNDDTAGHDSHLRAIAGPCESPQAAALAPLMAAINERHGPAVSAVVYYGACLRTGAIYEGLVDFYVVVDRYRHAHGHPISALANRLVPPNVYYLEAEGRHGRLRAKYAVISEAELARGCATALLSSLWGRLAQPVAIVQARDDALRDTVRAHLGAAVITLLDETLPLIASPKTPSDIFAAALALSYGGELRTEGPGRSQAVAAADRAEYSRRLHAARPLLALDVSVDTAARLHWQATAEEQARCRRRWQRRRPLGRVVSVARLAKACFTFGNAVDYGAYKLERHTGEHIEVTDRLRRHPLIYAWPVLWRLYRRGLLR